ncbi:hypothetical protein TNIN_418111 [Trichonephila inaurata madagascariensis]|uniref:Uncharacterized protein n=1 Tax=Trichonephila inaurata madagascariensis TaxID=2747483 RepID=A0A8X6YAJ6_9ARAC|nr:hypothetical protein TNIN_418111 [Trichonephila inaurata madagascariensis]
MPSVLVLTDRCRFINKMKGRNWTTQNYSAWGLSSSKMIRFRHHHWSSSKFMERKVLILFYGHNLVPDGQLVTVWPKKIDKKDKSSKIPIGKMIPI